MSEITDYGLVVLLIAGAASIAVAGSKLTDWVRIPGPALLLVAAAVASDLFDGLHRVDFLTVERIAVVALVVILFEGGMHVGWRRFRESAVPIVALGVLGTFATAALLALAAHTLLGVSWTVAGLLGAALAPTDPAVMFSVLGNREVGGRTGTILEGESGANDPVGIALMIGMIELATHDDASRWGVLSDFVVAMVVGLAVGVAAGLLLAPFMRRIGLPDVQLYPLQVLALAGVVYGAASVAHGSGFLAVFVAGLLFGDARLPHKQEIERFAKSLSSLAEITVFLALGLTVSLGFIVDEGLWIDGLVLSVLLAFVIRPLVVSVLLLPARLEARERAFVAWGGLKGAVPILLAALAVLAGTEGADRIYGIVFVAVLFSVVVQGATIPAAARALRIPMRSLRRPT